MAAAADQLALGIDEDAGTIAERFEAFHERHPEVYEHLVKLARQARARGAHRWGIGATFEVLRWQYMIGDLSGEAPKLNNNFRALYARRIMEQEADLDGFFETRALRAL